MHILFISSGNNGISPIVKAQAESLQKAGLNVSFALIVGKGILGYSRNIPILRRKIRKLNPDVIHAHYSFCGIISFFATCKPVVCSLMGSDVMSSGFWRAMIRFFVRFIWKATIVKSEDMKNRLDMIKVRVIPNGVNLELFRPMDQSHCRKTVDWDSQEKIVLFAANPKRIEKNYNLALRVIESLKVNKAVLKVVHGISHEKMPIYLNAADALLLTSLWEGSPNIVKEAMACNLPIVSTDVGDVRWLLSSLNGNYVLPNDANALAISLSQAIEYKGKVEGKKRLIELELDAVAVSQKLKEIYMEVCKNNA